MADDPIEHVVVLMLENRSFDLYWARFRLFTQTWSQRSFDPAMRELELFHPCNCLLTYAKASTLHCP